MMVLCIELLSGCAAGDRAFEARRDFAVRFNKERMASSKSEVRTKWNEDILSALSLVDSTNFNKPRLASAILTKGKNGAYGLFVYWIENSPSVDGIEFQVQQRGSPLVIPIPEIELKQLRAEAKDTIVFGSENDWRETTEAWKTLDQIASAKDLKVRLLHGKVPATDWFPTDFYKVDRWIPDAVTNR
jgi:hypothetical protein